MSDESYLPETSEAVDDLVEKKLYDFNVVLFNDDVGQEEVGALIQRMRWISMNNSSDIHLYITTNGGCVYSFLKLYDFIRTIKNKVHVHSEGHVFSAGAFIASCCATGNRTATKNTTFMIHQISSWAIGKTDELKDDAEETDRLQKLIYRLLIKHTNLTKELLIEIGRKDYYFTANKAKTLGFVDVVK